jgi:hypothetical protein
MSQYLGKFFSTVGGQKPKSKLVMKNITSFALLSAFASVAATAAVTDPVGYMTIPLPGTGGVGASKLQIANQGLMPSGPSVVDDGTGVTFGSDLAGDFLEDSDGAWTAGDYVNGAEFSHVLELTSGAAHVGVVSFIESTTDTPARIYTADDLSAAGAGAGYRVWETYTIGSLFGNPPTADTAGGGTSAASADNILIYNPTSNTYTTFYYFVPAKTGTPEWRSDDVAITTPADYAIHPNDGILVQRRQSADGSLVISGAVKPDVTQVLVEGSGSADTLNILANQIPVPQLTPNNSGLFTGDPATGVAGGTSAAGADNILVFDATTNTYTTFYYFVPAKTGTPEWRSDDVTIPDAGEHVFDAEDALLLIRRSGGTSFEWDIPAVEVTP